MKEKTKVKKMYILDDGSFLYGRGMMQLGMDLDKRQRIIVPFFPDAQIYVQKDEFSFAQYPNAFQAPIYDKRIFALPTVKWKLLEGDGVIMPGLTVMMANGHTPGLQGLIIEFPESGYYLLGADSVYLTENIETAHPPGNVWNTVLAEYAVKRFKALQSLLDGQFFPGHDYDFYHNELNLGEAYG